MKYQIQMNLHLGLSFLCQIVFFTLVLLVVY